MLLSFDAKMLDHGEYTPKTVIKSLSEIFDENVAGVREQKLKDDLISDTPTNFQMMPFPFEQYQENQEFSYLSRASDYDNVDDEDEGSSCISSSSEQGQNNSISDLRSVISSKNFPHQKQMKRFFTIHSDNNFSSFEPTSDSSEE